MFDSFSPAGPTGGRLSSVSRTLLLGASTCGSTGLRKTGAWTSLTVAPADDPPKVGGKSGGSPAPRLSITGGRPGGASAPPCWAIESTVVAKTTMMARKIARSTAPFIDEPRSSGFRSQSGSLCPFDRLASLAFDGTVSRKDKNDSGTSRISGKVVTLKPTIARFRFRADKPDEATRSCPPLAKSVIVEGDSPPIPSALDEISIRTWATILYNGMSAEIDHLDTAACDVEKRFDATDR